MKKQLIINFGLFCNQCREKSQCNIQFNLPFGIYLQCLNCNTSEYLSAPQTKQMTKKERTKIINQNIN